MKYYRFAAAAGITVGDPVKVTAGMIRRLDLDSGQEIISADLEAPA